MILTDDEKELFENMLKQFSPMTLEEQMILFKMLIFEYLECCQKSKKANDTWKAREQTYEFLIQLFSNNVVGFREMLFSQVLKDYKEQFIITNLA